MDHLRILFSSTAWSLRCHSAGPSKLSPNWTTRTQILYLAGISLSRRSSGFNCQRRTSSVTLVRLGTMERVITGRCPHLFARFVKIPFKSVDSQTITRVKVDPLAGKLVISTQRASIDSFRFPIVAIVSAVVEHTQTSIHEWKKCGDSRRFVAFVPAHRNSQFTASRSSKS